VLDYLSCAPPSAKPQQWHRWRKKTLEQLKSGDPLEIAKIFCYLHSLEGKKGLSFTERKILLQVERMLVSEIAVAKQIPEDEVEGILAGRKNGRHAARANGNGRTATRLNGTARLNGRAKGNGSAALAGAKANGNGHANGSAKANGTARANGSAKANGTARANGSAKANGHARVNGSGVTRRPARPARANGSARASRAARPHSAQRVNGKAHAR
jgi:CarD, C-terminal domain